MDIQRIVLLFALATVGYLLILAWNRDYHQPVSPAVDQAVELPAEGGTSVGPQILESGSDELPAVEPEQQAASMETPQPERAVPYVKVTTDVFDVWIDPRGGDIKRLSLPKYPASLEDKDVPFLLVDPRNQYVIQSGLVGPNGPDGSAAGRPLYTSVRSDYRMDGARSLAVDLRYDDGAGHQIIKRFTFSRGSYLINVEFDIVNHGNAPWQGNFFAQLRRDGEIPAVEQSSRMGLRPYVGGAAFTEDAPYHKLTFQDVEETPFKQHVEGGYIAMVQHYFVTAWVPDTMDQYLYQARKVGDQDLYLMGFTGPRLTVPPGNEARFGARLYAGPKDQYKLREIAKGLDLTVDYGFLWWIAQPLFWLMTHIHRFVGNWGVSIILLTLLVKTLLYPLSAASFRSMAKMKKLAPEMQRLKERYGEDRQQFTQATMELYKREGANPLGGCLPIMLQMPVFLALYWTLMESVELRQAPFFWWIRDLSVMDPLFVLPILMGASMFLSQLMQPEPPDPVQAKVFKLMPIMFTFFFLWFPSGLVLYWLVNNLLSIAQQWLINRQIAVRS